MSLSLNFDHLPVKSIGALKEFFQLVKTQMGIFSVDIDDVQAYGNNTFDAIGCFHGVVSLIMCSGKNYKDNENDLPIICSITSRRAMCYTQAAGLKGRVE